MLEAMFKIPLRRHIARYVTQRKKDTEGEGETGCGLEMGQWIWFLGFMFVFYVCVCHICELYASSGGGSER